jgi:ABC-type transport system substrate-binding protein
VTLTASEKKITLSVNNDAESLAIAEIVKANWAELGFTVTVKALKTKTVTVNDKATNEKLSITDSALQIAVKEAGYGKRDFDVLALDWQLYSRDAFVGLASFTTTMNGSGADLSQSEVVLRENISGWTNEQYDAYITAAYTAVDEDVRAENLRKAEQLLIEESPIVPLVSNQSFAFISRDLSRVETDGQGNFVFVDTKQKNYRDYITED